MSLVATETIHFVLSAFDRDQWCPVLQARFHVTEFNALRMILGEGAKDDSELQRNYVLGPPEMEAIIEQFEVAFDPGGLETGERDIFLFRLRGPSIPYLVHAGYEFPLLLEGRKKLAKMYGPYPPMTFDGEEKFDRWVADGVLHREEVLEPFDPPTRRWQGHRVVYYTLKGEEWRIPAMKLIWQAAAKAGGWNEYFERLEGMLYGYEDWQNDWWIDFGLRRGGFGGMPLCCAVTAAGLAWLEAAGFRALPPIDKPTLAIASFDPDSEADMRSFMLETQGSVALVRFKASYRTVTDLMGAHHDHTRYLLRERIPELNRNLRGPVVLVMRVDKQST
jgi:hypothetical protein